MLHKIMVMLVASVALAGASVAEAAPHGAGAAHMGGGFGTHVGGGFGGRIGGGSFGGAHLGGAFGGAHLGGGFRGSHSGGQAFGLHRNFGHSRAYGYWPGGDFGCRDPVSNYYRYDRYRGPLLPY